MDGSSSRALWARAQLWATVQLEGPVLGDVPRARVFACEAQTADLPAKFAARHSTARERGTDKPDRIVVRFAVDCPSFCKTADHGHCLRTPPLPDHSTT